MGSASSSSRPLNSPPPGIFETSHGPYDNSFESTVENNDDIPRKTHASMATIHSENSQRDDGLKTERAGESSRPTSATSRHSVQSPVPGAEEEDPTPEDLVQKSPKYSGVVPFMEKVIDGCQDILNNSEEADLYNYAQVAHTFGVMRDIVEDSGQTFMADYLAVKGFIPLSKQLHDLMLKTAGISSLLQWECSDTKEETYQRPEYFIATFVKTNWCDLGSASPRVAKKMVPTTILQDLVTELQGCEERIHERASSTSAFDAVVTVLHNCAKETSARQQLRETQLVEVLLPYLKVDNPSARILVLLTLGLIIDESQNRLLFSDDKTFDLILQFIRKAWQDPDHCHEGYQLEALIVGTCNIAKNEPNKKILVDKNVLKYLEPILKTGTDAEKKVAAEAVLELAFDSSNHAKIKEMTGCMEALEAMLSSANRGIRKAAQGTMWLLSPDKLPARQKKEEFEKSAEKTVPGEPPSPASEHMSNKNPAPPRPSPGIPPAPVDKQGGHIMISYNWSEQKLIFQVRDALREHGLSVWIDVDDMGGSPLEAMAKAVEEADVVLICFSQNYKRSQNCRMEAEYAFTKKKRIVLLKTERDYRPDGWLGIICGTKLYYDFSGKYPFDQKMAELLKELNHKPRDGLGDITDAPIKEEKAQDIERSESEISEETD